MSNDPVYLIIRVTQSGRIDSVATADGTPIPESEQDLIDAPIKLGEKLIGEFRTITLVKLIAPDGSYTWFVKTPVGFCTGRPSCRWLVADESYWIKPEQAC